MLSTLVMSFIFITQDKKYLKADAILKLMVLFVSIMAISLIYTPNTRAAFGTTELMFWTLVATVFPLCVILTRLDSLLLFFKFWVAIQVIVAIEVIINGGHGAGSYLRDENDVALVLNMALPLPFFMAKLPKATKSLKRYMYISMAIIFAAIITTGSRGGALGVAAIISMILIMSARPVRNILIATALLVSLSGAVLSFVPDAVIQDFRGIEDPNDSTRDARLWAWSVGWVMFLDNPVLGVGAGNYPWTNHLYARLSPMYNESRQIFGGRPAHSIYFTLLPEDGLVGTSIFLAMLWGCYKRYKDIKLHYLSVKPDDDAYSFYILFKGMIISVVAYLVTGAFISVLYYPPFWHLLGFMVATFRAAATNLPDFKTSIRV